MRAPPVGPRWSLEVSWPGTTPAGCPPGTRDDAETAGQHRCVNVRHSDAPGAGVGRCVPLLRQTHLTGYPVGDDGAWITSVTGSAHFTAHRRRAIGIKVAMIQAGRQRRRSARSILGQHQPDPAHAPIWESWADRTEGGSVPRTSRRLGCLPQGHLPLVKITGIGRLLQRVHRAGRLVGAEYWAAPAA